MAENPKDRVLNFISEFKKDNLGKSKIKLLFAEVLKYLEEGKIRSAEKVGDEWQVNQWVKEAIMIGFKTGVLEKISNENQNFFDKDTLPLQNISLKDGIRLVPGGSSIRCGSYIANGTIVMPPSYINIGVYIDTGCMIDSHALVGSCAQIGKNVHLSAASQVGGVLEPIGAMPVIIEDDVFIGGNCGLYEGVIIKTKAVIGTGVILNASTPVFDNTTGEFLKKTQDKPLIIPENAVVIAGSRPINSGMGQKYGVHIYCPVIIKYRDSKTDTAVVLEELLR
ncbi:MAG TPA: 2,3,4,5-tetrahydropyridine-2,6-dicarboxylate N-succinyltransferase [Ignavibacteria bacterium]|nr:2,3,4,5-tetrahydropyridine-2,6-dicarboxylate N-succinyltransferase [Ignavibacteria bacterium]